MPEPTMPQGGLSPASDRDLGEAGPGPSSQRAVQEEKFLVTVRMRPLSRQEATANDWVVWQCDDEHSLSYTEPVPERSPYPASYTFDRVFPPDTSSWDVYAHAAREVVLTALTGFNGTVFAYGQTSSGKTYTMRSVVEYAVQDIFKHILENPSREFLIRVSALEIYNEVVRDLLNPDGGPLRLLDDPERGTVVERLAEEVVRSSGHLMQIVQECEARREVADTLLNDASSRSHQIFRLTIESCPCAATSHNGDLHHVLVSSLNFVDLAGSERVSQTLAEGQRLKEGGHINRSLLTLGTVIRKLSDKKRDKGHIPYRDSKLTRILQPSLGGNSRTAIVCTMSPGNSMLEQTRNTLSFALHATQVTNSAHVNLVVSDKVMIKQLQREVGRLNAQLADLKELEERLRQKDHYIHEIEMQNHELATQRDTSQAQVKELTKMVLASEDPQKKLKLKSWSPETVKRILRRTSRRKFGQSAISESASESTTTAGSNGRLLEFREMRERRRERERRERLEEAAVIESEKRKLHSMQRRLGTDADDAVQALHKEIECLRLAQAKTGLDEPTTLDVSTAITRLQGELEQIRGQRGVGAGTEAEVPAGADGGGENVNGSLERMIQLLKEELSRLQTATRADEQVDQDIATLEEKLQIAQKSLNKLCEKETGQTDAPGAPPGGAPASGAGPGSHPTSRPNSPPTPGRQLYLDGRQLHLDVPSEMPSPSPRGLGLSDTAPTPHILREMEVDENSPLGRRPKEGGEGSAIGRTAMLGSGVAGKQSSEGGKGAKTSGSGVAGGSSTTATAVDIRRMQNLFRTAAEENVKSIKTYVADLKERIAKLHYQKQLLLCQVLELEADAKARNAGDGGGLMLGGIHYSPEEWQLRLEEQLNAIAVLWDMCNVSLLHRTQFFLLFSTCSPADGIYLEVEYRRLEWLRDQCLATLVDGEEEPAAIRGSLAVLNRERSLVARRLGQRLRPEEREELLQEWGISLSSKRRKLQLAYALWREPQDLGANQDSAEIVARVMDLGGPTLDGMVPGATFGLEFGFAAKRPQGWLMRLLAYS